MKLLIITQKVDLNDDLLGFFHNWLKEFSKRYEIITVICLEKGEYNLPNNIKVLSLGKEKGNNKIKYIYNFYKIIWSEKGNYDGVFVHMNKEYIILGGLLWKLINKKIYFWYNHKKGNILSKISGAFANIIFFTSPYSYFSKNKKARMMPVGIDTNIFKKLNNIIEKKNSLLFIGRLSPVKNLEIIIKAVKNLDLKGIDFILNIYGNPGLKDKIYFEDIKKISSDLEKKGKIKFLGNVPNYKTPEIYNKNEIFINSTNSGSLDKTILEAMSCGKLILVSNNSFKGLIDDIFIYKERDEIDMAKKIVDLLKLDKNKKNNYGEKFINFVKKNHSLSFLMEKIFEII